MLDKVNNRECKLIRNLNITTNSKGNINNELTNATHVLVLPYKDERGQRIIKSINKPSRHECISDVSLRRLIQRLRDISKRVNLQISETSPGRLIRDFSSETSLRSLRFSQRRLRVASETVILGLETKGSFWLPTHQPMSL